MWASILAYLDYEKGGSTWRLGIAGGLAAVAIAFKLPGLIVVPLVMVAILSRRISEGTTSKIPAELGIFAGGLVLTLTLLAPEWIGAIPSLLRFFSLVLGTREALAGPIYKRPRGGHQVERNTGPGRLVWVSAYSAL